MACFSPMEGWKSQAMTEKGKRRTVFHRREGFADLHQVVPCGVCLGCQAKRVQDWAVRCQHEARMHTESCFVTLTYRDEDLPHVGDDPDGPVTLRPEDFVLFMKRLRFKRSSFIGPLTGERGVRFFQAGEYGSKGRPHHHALLYGYWPGDSRPWRKSKGKGGAMLYVSEELTALWGKGFTSHGAVEPDSAAYVAQYALKKCGPVADAPGRVPEYQTMSRNPGIGAAFFSKFGSDLFPSDEVVHGGRVSGQPPRYYLDRLSRENPDAHKAIKQRRRQAFKPEETGALRLYARQEVRRARMKRARRSEVQ